MKIKSVLFTKSAENLGRRLLWRCGALLLARAMAHRTISASAAAGRQGDQPAVSKNTGQTKSRNRCLPPFVPLMAPCTAHPSHPYPAWLLPQLAIMSSKWRLLLLETGRRADAR